MNQPRYNEKAGIYRDCKWCGGKGCVYCPGEADAEYKRQFPDGPKPIATFDTDAIKSGVLKSILGPEAIEASRVEGERRAREMDANNPAILDLARQVNGISREEAFNALAVRCADEAFRENIIKVGNQTTQGGGK